MGDYTSEPTTIRIIWQDDHYAIDGADEWGGVTELIWDGWAEAGTFHDFVTLDDARARVDAFRVALFERYGIVTDDLPVTEHPPRR